MNTEIQKLEPDQPNDFRNYYYYENDNIKVDVKFVKLDNEKYNKIIKTYYLNTYSENDANKVKERLKLKKFGQATNNDNHTFTKIGEDVFFEINPELKLYYFKKKEIKNKYTLLCIPMLNPDGAFLYTRENANSVDLNRDAFLVSQPEMQLLHTIYKEFEPDF